MAYHDDTESRLDGGEASETPEETTAPDTDTPKNDDAGEPSETV